MAMLHILRETYGHADCRDLGSRKLEQLRDGLKTVAPEEITSADDGKEYIELLRKFREAVAENDKLHGENYPQLLNSLLSVGEDGLYSNNLRFLFELIQNVDDCDFHSTDDCRLDMRFDFSNGEIILSYNEVGFIPFNVFAITGIAEAAKNVSASKNEIGEKGIGFKSVFGVAKRVLIRSGWFSFELYKDNFTIPVPSYSRDDYCNGTQMTLYVPGRAEEIYYQVKKQYCRKDAIFSRNPLLFLNKLTSLKMYFDKWRSMEFRVTRSISKDDAGIQSERDVTISVDLHDYENCYETNVKESILCTRYTYPVTYSRKACQARYGEDTEVGSNGGKKMFLQAVMPNTDYIEDVGAGSLYSFLPTQLKLTVPIVCHVPFKLDASREFVDPQDKNPLWFQESSKYLSELMDYAYSDWCKVTRENIVGYLPGVRESLFAKNNGKEECLSEQKCFLGSHYLQLPLFRTVDETFRTSSDIFCFVQEEDIAEPEKVYRWMGYRKALFIPPASVRIIKFGIDTERNVNAQLFRNAIKKESITSEALDYLDSVGFEYSEKNIPDQELFELTAGQIETIMRHNRFADLFQKIACNCVRNNMRPKFSIAGAALQQLSEKLYPGFELKETPRQVENYMTFCGGKCVCMDIDESRYLPCYNAVLLSNRNILSSFAAFCYAMDQRDTFAARIKLREASIRLNQYVEDDTRTAADFLRDLKNIRLSVKETLGNDGYKSYIGLILKSGTDRGRFIQEILQNADDCDYPEGATPTFLLKQQHSSVVTEYNEVGFTRANIRSITAIGESTKNKLLNGETIGEKGVGFKTIFAIASEVRIFSGDYNFALTDREPTIPKSTKAPPNRAEGTRMEILLKDKSSFPSYNEKAILELCLCLRKLKKLEIGAHTVTIEDIDNRRIITIDKKQHAFKKYAHSFVVDDKEALREHENGTRKVSPKQNIICFVPEKNELSEYSLYTGMPTKYKIKIPLVIDAPFELTTSREEIDTGSISWNPIVRKEMYTAIRLVMDSLKTEERSSVLRYARFVHRIQGNIHVYVNDISDCSYLTSYPFLEELKSSNILPTFDPEVFAMPSRKTALRYPDAANILFRLFSTSDFGGIRPASVIDVPSTDYEAALNAFGCEFADFQTVFSVIAEYAEEFIHEEEFRTKLYEYLQNTPDEYRDRLKQYSIIPVFGKTSGETQYIPWKNDSIFVKRGTYVSGADYYVLNEKLLPKATCERIFDVNINEMNVEWERSRYNERLQKIIRGSDIEAKYRYLMSEYKSGALEKNASFGVLYALGEAIPLKNQLGEIVDTKLFLCALPSGYFPVRMIQRITVHEECRGFAEFMKCSELSGIHYENIEYHEELTADDVETLIDEYFVNSKEILQGFSWEGYLSDKLLSKYQLDYLAYGRTNEYDETHTFPENPAGDRALLKAHVNKLWQNLIKVVSVNVEQTVLKGQKNNGETFDLRINDAREGALTIYTPEGAHGLCFCQMCHQVKPHRLIEVNNIEAQPRYYFPQLRISLCLECSKRFESLRSNEEIRNEYIEAIKTAEIQNQGKIDIPIGEETITFTANHLAEIQEILTRMSDSKTQLGRNNTICLQKQLGVF
ncbi:MAG TPA: hypothetical protein PLU75_07165 [Oscillospiraceae bacterium]|nr:hypothetical protein [Oscillospiraceae bacterium]HRW57004.1 hypothetical protein [Oscillospiraceae bacterium]